MTSSFFCSYSLQSIILDRLRNWRSASNFLGLSNGKLSIHWKYRKSDPNSRDNMISISIFLFPFFFIKSFNAFFLLLIFHLKNFNPVELRCKVTCIDSNYDRSNESLLWKKRETKKRNCLFYFISTFFPFISSVFFSFTRLVLSFCHH